ncbi:UvrD-helicase domain-containing protein [Vagococcus salmoninarum]|uniref:UvrD-helicase domain-containing protein n=1 Tax=Vagococcus salmoninarum TaxID=2739 RepID=UPI00187E80C0|nr:UvrD-helicase domain-containing protein [Vagococcus salmoninarum]MBE9390246.1 AAA family ATPase [Vagococcus salmoninarum]
MEIKVAGAGSGKTFQMAEDIYDYYYHQNNEDKNIFCVTFTNSATEAITEKLHKKFKGEVPINILVSTIHSFLNQEVISPYYFLLHEKQYSQISSKKLSSERALKNYQLKKLENRNILHVDKFSEKSKWVLLKKTGDKVAIKKMRKVIQENFLESTSCIFVDEVQDVDVNFLHILLLFNELGIDVKMVGDPKQDLTGTNEFRKFLTEPETAEKFNLKYITNCYRCPNKHLELSNLYISKEEKQVRIENKKGKILFGFESELNVEELIENNKFGLKYIYQKTRNFVTSKRELSSEKIVEDLSKELQYAYFQNKEISEHKKSICYFIASDMINQRLVGSNTTKKIIEKYIKNKIDNYYEIVGMIESVNNEIKAISVESINSVKGKEATECLFIIGTELMPYLLKKNRNDTSSKNKLYVALTRSLENLTIYVLKEAEEKYGKSVIENFLNNYAEKI